MLKTRNQKNVFEYCTNCTYLFFHSWKCDLELTNEYIAWGETEKQHGFTWIYKENH